MKAEDIRKELKNKERSLVDLHRYITTRTDNNPNYFLMLGAGCSVSSGIKTGKELIENWRKEVFFEFEKNQGVAYDVDKAIEFLLANCGNWYNKSNEYSSLFEKKYDLPRQRRMFVEKQVSDAQPSLGYAYLTGLVDDSYFNSIFTTNFDDLLNESFYQFTNLRPIVCAHDSSISSVTVTSKRPKVIKLHGDYLFDDIKSTLRETESLEENIKNKFIEFSKDYGIIVVGYSGCDRSIMDVMNYLLKQEDYLKNGIYWCLREGDEVSEELRKLLWKDKVYYVMIDGFDDFFAYHYSKINGGRVPLDTGFISSKSQDVVKRMLKNETLKTSKSKEIKRHLSELTKQSKMHSLQNMLKSVSNNEYVDNEEQEHSDDELLKIFKVKEKLNRKLFGDAIALCRKYEGETSQNKFKIEIYRHMIEAHKGLKEYDQILKTYDKIIDIDSKNPVNFLNKAKYEKKFENKLFLVNSAMDKDDFFYGNYYEKAELLSKKYFMLHDSGLFDEILDLYDDGLKKYPTINNPCWEGKFDFVKKSRTDKDSKLPILDGLISALEEQNPFSYKVLRMRMNLNKYKDIHVDEEFLDVIKEARSRRPEKYELDYDMLTLEALSKVGDKLKIEDFIRKIDSIKKYEKSSNIMALKAEIMAEKLCDIDGAIAELEKILKYDSNVAVVNSLIQYRIYKKDFDNVRNDIDKYSSDLSNQEILNHEKDFLEYQGDDKGAYLKFLEYLDEALFPEHHSDHLTYYLMKIGEYEEAKKKSKEYLDAVNFSKYAEVAIINYELSQILIDGKKQANKKRLIEVYESTASESTKAAIQCLLKDQDKAFNHIIKAIDDDYTCRFVFEQWPVFRFLHDDNRWKDHVAG